MSIPPSDIDVTGPTILGKQAAGVGVAEEISPTDATAMLDEMVGDSGSGGTKGLVPAPAAGDAAEFKFLKADGMWASATPDTVAAFIYLDTDQTLTDNVETAISFTDEVFDTDNLWASSPNPTRLTVPSDGFYAVRGKVAVNVSFVGAATVRIYVNGTMAASVTNAGENLGTNDESHEVSALLELTAGDFLELKVLLAPYTPTGTHDVSGGNSTVTTFAAFKVASQGGGSGGGATVEVGTEALRPAAGTDQRLYLPTDGSYLHEDDSIEWRSWGPIYPQTMPTTSGFSLVNGSTATATLAANGRLVLECTGVGNVGNVIMYTKTAPATPWSFIVRADAVVPKRSYLAWGLVFRASGSGNFATFGAIANGPIFELSSSKGALSVGVPVLTAHYLEVPIEQAHLAWLKISDDGTNRTCQVSPDGVNWFLFHSVGRTDHLTANEYGYFMINQNVSTPNYGLMISVSSAAIQ